MNIFPSVIPCGLKKHVRLILTILLCLLISSVIFAQPKLSDEQLRLLKERKLSFSVSDSELPTEVVPLSSKSGQILSNALGGNVDPTFNVSVMEGAGYVNETIIQPDGKIIAVGLFHSAGGVRSGGIARFNADGSRDTTFNSGTGANALIYTAALQSDGKILIGGNFTSYQGQAITRLARLNTDGSLDTTFLHGLNFSAQINTITFQPDGKILVGGNFNAPAGNPLRGNIVRLNPDGMIDSTFNNGSMNVGAVGGIYKIIYLADNKILIAGSFGSFNSITASRVARLNNDGTLDTSFNTGTGPNGVVWRMIVEPNGKILISGIFTSFSSTPTDSLARLNENGSLADAFEITDSPSSSLVFGLALQSDGKIIVGVTDESNIFDTQTLRINPDKTIDSTFLQGNTEKYAIRDINIQTDGKLLIGGDFISYNDQTHLHLARVESSGAVDAGFNASISTTGTVTAIKRQPDGKILIAGDFQYVNGIRTGAIARLNPDGSVDETFTLFNGLFGFIYAIGIQPDGKIIIGGNFLSTDKSSFGVDLIRLNSNGSFDLNLYPVDPDTSIFQVFSVALQSDGKIIIGGNIRNTQSQGISALRINPNGGLDQTFTPLALQVSTTRAMLVQPNDKILIGGTFSLPRRGILRLNSNGTFDETSSFGANSSIYAIAQQPDGKILAGGVSLTRYDTEGNVDTTFNTGSGFNQFIRAIEVLPDGKILAGGNFTIHNGNPANYIVRLNNDGAIDLTFNASASGPILALEQQPNGKVLVGGQFLDFNGIEKFSIVRLEASENKKPGFIDFDGDGKTDISIFRPSVGEWWYLRSSDGGNRALQFGSSSDKVVAADYTGDGKTDVAFWRESTGEWFILRSEDYSFYSFPFGASGDIPTPADFDGDGLADPAVFRPSTGTWFILRSSDLGITITNFGADGDQPVAADYDGDGKADIAIFRPSDGSWWLNRSSAGLIVTNFGISSDKAVPADYTGDGKTDVAFWRPSTGEWFVLRSEDFSFYSVPFGTAGDIPAPGDYDGDGRVDTAVFRPSNAIWYMQQSTNGFSAVTFGAAGDQPVPNAFVR